MKRLQNFARGALILLGGLLIVYLAVRLVGPAFARPTAAHPWFAARPGQHNPLVFAHQGGENLWPTNTMYAYQNALRLGVDVIDADMHMTKDGVLVLMHDQTVDRTTDGSGAIRDLTLAQIKQLDAGYRFSLDDGKTFPHRGQGLQVPTLEEAFQAFPGQRFGIEIKQTDPKSTARRFCDLIRKYQMQDKVLVSSFRQENMDAFRKDCPEVATSATQTEVTIFYLFYRLGLSRLITPNYNSFQVPEESGGIHLLTPGFMVAAHERGLPVQPWTINDTPDLQRILALGVDGINTDNPDRLLELLR
jgi:glycerophosphoryl diester phosphodiesterase